MDRENNKLDNELIQDVNDNQPVGNAQKLKINALQIDMEHHVFVGGITQSGKSFFIKRLFDSMPLKSRKCIFLDYKHDPNHKSWYREHKYPVVHSLSGIKRKWFKPAKILNIFKKKTGIPDKLVYQPPRPKGFAGAFNMLDELSEYVFRKGNIILFIDEIAPLMTAASIPPSFYDCLIMGASRGITVVSVSQRPKDIHNTVMSESYTKVIFRLTLEDDRKKIKGFSSREVAETLQNIPNKQFIIIFADGTYERCQLNK